MNNQVILIGRLVKQPTQGDNHITLAIPRSFKNSEGEYETDFIHVLIQGAIQENVIEYCCKGDLIGVRGRLTGVNEDDGDGHYTYKMELVADKITYLAAKKREEI